MAAMVSPGPSVPALRKYHRQVAGMLADPDLTGDLLAVGLYLAWHGCGGWEPMSPEGWARALFPPLSPLRVAMVGETPEDPEPRPDIERFRKVMRDDIRRYDWQLGLRRGCSRERCMAPMIRRAGVCGGTNHRGCVVTDVATGEKSMLTACSKHLRWYDEQRTANRAAVAAAGDTIPRPAANTGGVLAKHFPEIAWEEYWQQLDPSWTPPPEQPGTVRPTLRLIVCDEPAMVEAPRPRFALLPGGGTS